MQKKYCDIKIKQKKNLKNSQKNITWNKRAKKNITVKK